MTVGACHRDRLSPPSPPALWRSEVPRKNPPPRWWNAPAAHPGTALSPQQREQRTNVTGSRSKRYRKWKRTPARGPHLLAFRAITAPDWLDAQSRAIVPDLRERSDEIARHR